jgi:hypothetical protein
MWPGCGCSRPHGGAAGGGAAGRFDDPVPRYARALLPAVNRLYRAAGLASGCFLFRSRPVFEAAGGFDETLFGAEELAMSRSLCRQGRFAILREAVTTSGRKLRAYSGREILTTRCRLGVRGWAGVRDRGGMDIWYGDRRDDPKDAGRTASGV